MPVSNAAPILFSIFRYSCCLARFKRFPSFKFQPELVCRLWQKLWPRTDLCLEALEEFIGHPTLPNGVGSAMAHIYKWHQPRRDTLALYAWHCHQLLEEENILISGFTP